MRFVKRFDVILLIGLFLYSCWFMWKSFSIDPQTNEFVVARNVVGDFGLHLSLVRSISWGDNIPVQSPFFPGVLMPYHYAFDVLVGLLARAGMRIDIAMNGLSALAFTALLYVMYLLPQSIFGKGRMVGLIAVLLFIFHSSLTFIDYFAGRTFSLSLLTDIWRLPNYIHAGPFDGSLISIFFTPNVYANQRHTVAALAIGLWIIYLAYPYLTTKKKFSFYPSIFLGILLGILGWVHTLLFIGFALMVAFLGVIYRKWSIIWIFILAAIICIPRVWIVMHAGLLPHAIWNPGFLSPKPFEWFSWVNYWWVNLGVALILISASLLLVHVKERLLFYGALIVFILANILQFSYRIDHNHTLINLFIIIGNFYIAYGLCWLWKKGFVTKVIAILLFSSLFISGLLDLMVVKNDFQLRVADAPKNQFMQWVKRSPRNTVFLAQQNILDPITLSGRFTYVGHDYYLSVMGYNTGDRLARVKKYFEATSSSTIMDMKKQGIEYVALPKGAPQDFPYTIDWNFWEAQGVPVYEDARVSVYRL